jgi:hypothetical protein
MMRLWSTWTDWTAFNGNILFPCTPKASLKATLLWVNPCVNLCVKMVPKYAKTCQNRKKLDRE